MANRKKPTLRAARLEALWTQKVLAEQAEVAKVTISFIETGRSGGSDLIREKLAAALGYKVSDIRWPKRPRHHYTR